MERKQRITAGHGKGMDTPSQSLEKALAGDNSEEGITPHTAHSSEDSLGSAQSGFGKRVVTCQSKPVRIR